MEQLGAALDGDILSRRRYRPKKEGQTGFLMLEGMVQAAIGGPLESPPTSPTGDNTAAFTRTCTPSSSTSSLPPAPCTPGPSSLPASARAASPTGERCVVKVAAPCALDARAFWAVRFGEYLAFEAFCAARRGRTVERTTETRGRDAAGDEYCERVVVVGFEESPVPAPLRPFFDAASIAPVVHTRGYASRFDEACPLVMRTELPLLGDRAFIRGMQWVQPAADNGGGGGCVVHSRVELCVTMLGAGGLVEKFLEQKFREEFEATGRRAEEFVAERGKAGGAPARPLRRRSSKGARYGNVALDDDDGDADGGATAGGAGSPEPVLMADLAPPLPRKSAPAAAAAAPEVVGDDDDGGAVGCCGALPRALRRRFARRERELREVVVSTLDGI